MMSSELHWINFAFLCAAFVLATLGIFSSRFNDNLLQRIGMVMLACGSFFAAYHYFMGTSPGTPRFAILYGVVFYGLGKAWRLTHDADKPSRYRRWKIMTTGGPMQVRRPEQCETCANLVDPAAERSRQRTTVALYEASASVDGLISNEGVEDARHQHPHHV